MPIDHYEIFVEEPSMEAFLAELLPRIIPDGKTFSIYTYRGKSDLLRKLPSRLAGYRSWLPDNYGIVVLLDRDDEDCVNLKERVERYFQEAGINTRSNPGNGFFSGVSRIAIEELEAWYFGNWAAVVKCYPLLPHTIPSRASYRNSDNILGGTWEAFERICKTHGLFSAGLRKVEAARTIASEIRVEENTSPSFASFISGLTALSDQ